ncbi:MAG: urease accessory protein UreG [Acidimicrobiales bacterium]|nr:urease accessory protein UreG [Acidimicrobiales bacterium]
MRWPSPRRRLRPPVPVRPRGRSCGPRTIAPGRCVSLLHDLGTFGSGGPHDHADDHDHHDHAGPGAGPRRPAAGPLKVGIGGPVGSGKTALVVALCRALQPAHRVAVITNDIYTQEDAAIVRRAGVVAEDHLLAVQTGCCPHTAIRDDIAANVDAIETLVARHPDLDVVLVESGGDNLTATFSPRLVDVQLFVIDVAGGDKVPRKGGPGITRSDLLVINKTDLAPLVGADLGVMARDAAAARGARPTAFVSLVEDPQAGEVARYLEELL